MRVFVCQADEETIRRRLVARIEDRHTISDAHIDIWPALRAGYSEPAELDDTVTLDTTAAPARVIEQALATLHLEAFLPVNDRTSEVLVQRGRSPS